MLPHIVDELMKASQDDTANPIISSRLETLAFLLEHILDDRMWATLTNDPEELLQVRLQEQARHMGNLHMMIMRIARSRGDWTTVWLLNEMFLRLLREAEQLAKEL